jgi:large subunit ribosomal protein L3
MEGMIGQKIGMTQLLIEHRALPATVIKAGPCYVVGKRTREKDGYEAVLLAYGDRKRATKPMEGVFKKASVEPKALVAEFKMDDVKNLELGQEVTVEIFKEGEKVNVTGWSKGRGFTGVVKRHGFSGGPDGHGSMSHKVPGSIGASANPSRVVKGKKLPGRMGGERVTTRNLEVIKIDKEEGLIVVKGSVAGARRGYLFINKSHR